MFSVKGVLVAPLLNWLAVTFVEIGALFLRDVEILKDTLVKSESLVLMDVEVVGEILVETLVTAEVIVIGDADKPADTVVVPEVLVLRDMDTVVESETPRTRDVEIFNDILLDTEAPVKIGGVEVREVESLADTLVESGTPGMRVVEILGDAALLDTEAVGLRAVSKLGDTIMETEALKVLLWLTAEQTRDKH